MQIEEGEYLSQRKRQKIDKDKQEKGKVPILKKPAVMRPKKQMVVCVPNSN